MDTEDDSGAQMFIAFRSSFQAGSYQQFILCIHKFTGVLLPPTKTAQTRKTGNYHIIFNHKSDWQLSHQGTQGKRKKSFMNFEKKVL